MIKMISNHNQRKIQKVRYTYLLPIPINHVRNMKIGKGDTLNVELQADNSLRITQGRRLD
jgi:hypothetical protein